MQIDTTDKQLKIELIDGVRIYIVYNDNNEYSNTIQYTSGKYDRKRFDNFDKNWDVISKPRHYHPRNKKNAIKSEMIGDPEYDIARLTEKL